LTLGGRRRSNEVVVESRRRCGLVLALLVAAWAPCAEADRLDALRRAAGDPSWRVRLQAASVLGKSKNAEALSALEQLLGDENDNVRGVATAAIGELARADGVDVARVRLALEKAEQDPNAGVRERARSALAKLEAAVPHHAGSAALHIAIGGVGAKPKNVSPEMTNLLRQYLVREFSHTPGITLDGQPVSGFLIDSSITQLNRRTTHDWVEINCEISVVVGRLPSKAMVMMTSGGATVQQPKGAMSPRQASSLEADALEGAVKGAHENLLAYLRAQR
jgi:hypothetical protein